MISPEPVPLPPAPLAEMVTTDGRTWLATEVTAHTEAELAAVLPADDAADDEFGEATAAPISPPPTPTTTKARTRGAHGHQRRRFPGTSCLPCAGP